MPDSVAPPCRGLSPVRSGTLPEMKSSVISSRPPSSSHFYPRSVGPLDFFGSIKSLVERTLLPRDLEELGPESLDFQPEDSSCYSPPKGYPTWSVVDGLNEEVDALRNRVKELERALERQHQQQLREESLKPELGDTVRRIEAVRGSNSVNSRAFGSQKSDASLDQPKADFRTRQENDKLADFRDRFPTFLRDNDANTARKDTESDEALVKTPEDLKQAREELSQEQRYAPSSKNETEQAPKQWNEGRKPRYSARAGLAKVREEVRACLPLRQSKEEVVTNHRQVDTLRLDKNAADRKQERVCLAKAREGCRKARVDCDVRRKELRTPKKKLTVELKVSAALTQGAGVAHQQLEGAKRSVEGDLAESRDGFREPRKALTAKREIYKALSQKADASSSDLKATRAKEGCAEASLARGADDKSVVYEESGNTIEALRRAEASLVAERKRFSEYMRTTEAKMELLRRDAARVGKLEDELMRKTLCLKKKNAEARDLVSERKLMKNLREKLLSKENALNELRQELDSLRQASMAATGKQRISRLQKWKQDLRTMTSLTNATSAASSTRPIASPTLDMTCTFSISSVEEDEDRSGEAEAVGLGESLLISMNDHDAEEGKRGGLSVAGQENGGARGTDSVERPTNPPRLNPDLAPFKKNECDEVVVDDDNDVAGMSSEAKSEASVRERASRFDSRVEPRAAKVSRSLSPARRSRAKTRSSTRSRSLSPFTFLSGREGWSTGYLGQSHANLRIPMVKRISSRSRYARESDPLNHGVSEHGNIVVLELGAWRVRAGVVATSGAKGRDIQSFFNDFPCCVARPTREDADLDELVNGASSLAAPMYAKFRETGVFVGGDAWYCCLDHPSIALRSKLRLSCPMQRGKKLSREDTDMLVDHAFGMLNQDSSCTPTLLTYKPTATADEVLEMVSVLLEAHRVPLIRMVNEAEVAALAVGLSTGVLVDIGESGFSVTPIFEGCPVAPGARWEACGGADVTEFMDTMLHSRANEQFNQMTDRRRLEVSRELKEKLCYVPLDFNVEVEDHGSFRQRVMRICEGARVSPMLSQYEACDSETFLEETQEDAGVTTTKSFTLKSGDELVVMLGKERFHAPEILFTPSLWNDAGASKGLPEVLMDALVCMDTDTMAEMLGDVVVVGGSAAFEGLGDRLEEELKALLPERLAIRVEVRVPSLDDLRHRNPLSRCSPSAAIIGAEILLENEGLGGDNWVNITNWIEQPELLGAALAPFVRDD